MAMKVEQAARLGADLVEQARQDLGVEGDEVVLAHPADGAEDPVANRRRLVVAGAAQLEGQCRHAVASELACPHQTGSARRRGEHERRRARDQRAVEVEERRARPARGHRHVLAHISVVAEDSPGCSPLPIRVFPAIRVRHAHLSVTRHSDDPSTVLCPRHRDVVCATTGETESSRHPSRGVTGGGAGGELGVDSPRRSTSSSTSTSMVGAPPSTMTYSPRGSPSVDVAERAAHDGLVQLRQLPGHGDRPIRRRRSRRGRRSCGRRGAAPRRARPCAARRRRRRVVCGARHRGAAGTPRTRTEQWTARC